MSEQTTNDTKAMQTRKPPTQSMAMKDQLMKALPSIRAVLPKHLDGEKLLRIALVAMNRTPKLLQCTPSSVLQSVMAAAALGLQVDGVLGHGYLVPYGDQCQFIAGYKGLIDLARRGGHVLAIEAHAVFEADEFSYALGLDPKLKHVPSFADEPGELVAVYAVARLRDGVSQFEVMSRPQVDAIRKRSRSGGSGPWATDYAEMARKTVVRRLCKYLPLSVELAAALELEHRNDTGEASGFSDILDVSPEETPPAKPQGNKLAERAAAETKPAEREPGAEG